MTTRLFLDPVFEAHEPGPMHPESPGRLRAVRELLGRAPISGVVLGAPRGATDAELLRVHTAEHVQSLRAVDGRHAQLDPDTGVSPRSVEVAWQAAGTSAELALELWRGAAENGFALVRPPGHHAEAGQAMGFCLLNNVAVAAGAALAAGAQRILVLDWDVHHGNGTQSIFYGRHDVLYVSIHQSPLYPGTGALADLGTAEGLGFNLNFPLPPGQTDADYGPLFDDLIGPVARAYQPELVLVSAGFDAHRDDPLGQMRLTELGFAAMCTAAAEIAAASGSGRLGLFLEGGYDLDALANSAHACLEVLAGHRRERFPPGGGQAARDVARRLKHMLRDALPARLLDEPRWREATRLS
jgi:acetoin utilization deacetylase AcuC-like enzyme